MNTPVKTSIARPFVLCALTILMLISWTFLPAARAALDPPPDGGYPGNNTAEGSGTLSNLGAASQNNTAVGFYALSNTSGSNNTAEGSQALTSNTTASDNTAVGSAAGLFIKGSQNTAIGSFALFGANNATASYNTAIGFQSLYSVTAGYGNVANGWQALYSNRSGIYNTATGAEALYNNDADANNVSDFNTATGGRTLYTNVRGTSNTATGYLALYNNTSGSYNTAEGISALSNNTIGSNNVAVGKDAGASLTTGSNNIVIGAGVLGVAGEGNTTRIGKSTQKKVFISGISGKTVANGVAVIINSTGQLGTIQSSARYKDDIRPMDKASDAILALKPVTFRYKEGLDPDKIPQFGLIAEEVEKIDPDLVTRDVEGKPETVRYEAVNAMLLNEFLKEHRRTQEQAAKVAELESRLAGQQKQIESLTAGLQKVQFELTHPVLRVAVNKENPHFHISH